MPLVSMREKLAGSFSNASSLDIASSTSPTTNDPPFLSSIGLPSFISLRRISTLGSPVFPCGLPSSLAFKPVASVSVNDLKFINSSSNISIYNL